MRPVFHALNDLLVGNRRRFGAAVAALVVASCLFYLAPLVPQVVLDEVLVPSDQPHAEHWLVHVLGGKAWLREHLWAAALMFVAITALACCFTYLRGRLSATATENAIRRLRNRLYDRLQHLPVAHFDTVETGDLVQRCTSDVGVLCTFLESHVAEIGRALIMLLVPLPLMFAIDPTMTFVAVGLVPIVVAFSFFYFRRVRGSFTLVDEAEGRLTATLQQNLTGIRVVRAFARQDFECERFGARNREHRDATAHLFALLAWFWSISDLLCMAQRGVVVVYGVIRLAEGTLQIGAFFYFLTAVTMFVYPLRMMGRIIADLGKTTVAVGRLREILEAPIESAPAEPIDPGTPNGELVLDDVRFAHGEGPPALAGISLHVPAGSTLALVGPSGSGKSTIIELILRLRDPSSGTITLDGIDLAQLDRKRVRGRIAVVMPDPFLYSRTVGDNLRFGRPDADQAAMVEAARSACMHDAVEGFAHGYDTMVGERGVTLSGGQRQRLALARALLQQPAVLVLDDALSAVDTRTESAILDALAERRGRHSTILIAHRLSTVMLADRIVMLERGKIVQHGTHDELVRTPGPYQRLWALQQSAMTSHNEDATEPGAMGAAE